MDPGWEVWTHKVRAGRIRTGRMAQESLQLCLHPLHTEQAMACIYLQSQQFKLIKIEHKSALGLVYCNAGNGWLLANV